MYSFIISFRLLPGSAKASVDNGKKGKIGDAEVKARAILSFWLISRFLAIRYP